MYKSKGSFTMDEYFNNLIKNIHQLCILNLIGIFILILRYFFLIFLKYGVYENGIKIRYKFVRWQDILKVYKIKSFQIKSGSNDNIFIKLAIFDLSFFYLWYRLIMFDKEVTYYGVHLRDGSFLVFPTTRKDEFENAIRQAGYENLLKVQ